MDMNGFTARVVNGLLLMHVGLNFYHMIQQLPNAKKKPRDQGLLNGKSEGLIKKINKTENKS